GYRRQIMSMWLNSLRRLCRRMSRGVLYDPQTTQLIDCQAFALAPPRTRAETAKPAHKESRKAMRHRMDKEVVCQRETRAGITFMGGARNVSRGGMGLIVGCRFEPGTVLLIEVADGPGDMPRLIPALVVHARPLPYRGWFLGCSFPAQITDADIASLS